RLDLKSRLLAGAPPLEALEAPLPIEGEPSFELRYLDKRRDFLSYLRIADCVACCFSSQSAYYMSGLGTLRWVYRLWQDPLSFGFHVCRVSRIEPCGFVFGGLGHDGRPLLLLNGLYLKRQRASLRSNLLAAIEEQFARPLGILEIGVANRYAGRGVM